MKRLIIIGAGGHGRSVAEAVNLSNEFEIVGFLDDTLPTSTKIWSYSILGNTSEISQFCDHANFAIVAIGNNRRRAELHQNVVMAGFQLAIVKHPSAIVSPSAIVGEGTAIMAGAIVGTESNLGLGVIINNGATVDHHCHVENFGHLGVNTSMAGGSILNEGAWLHAGSALGYGIKVPAWCMVYPGKMEIHAT